MRKICSGRPTDHAKGRIFAVFAFLGAGCVSISAMAQMPLATSPVVLLIDRPGDSSMFRVMFTADNCGGADNLSSEDIVEAQTREFPAGYWLSLHRCRGILHSYAGNMPFDAFKAQVMAGNLLSRRGSSVTKIPPFREVGRYTSSSWAQSDQTIARLASMHIGQNSTNESALKSAAGSPSVDDISRVHAQISAKYNGSRLTAVPGEEVYGSPMGDLYRVHRSVTELVCTKKRPAVYECSYSLHRKEDATESGWAGISGAVRVALGNMIGTGNTVNKFTYEYVRVGSNWSAPKQASEVADYARKMEEQRQQSGSKSSNGCGMYRDYSDLSSVAPRYSYQCNPGSTPDR